MARAKPVRRSKRRTANNNQWWILGGIVGGAVIVIAALALIARQKDEPGQKAFDPNFEPEVTGAPRVEVLPDDVIDYGNVKLDTTINTVYTVRNVGDEPLLIYGAPRVEVIQGCWPPIAVVSSTTIDPGHEATVSLSFMMHAGMDGQHEFRVHLRTNDPAEPDRQLTVLSNWVP